MIRRVWPSRTRAGVLARLAGSRWLLQGMLPLPARRVPAELLAGLTLAAVGIPEVLGYARIAGMPVVTGLYTIGLPMLVFAVFGSSRHLVIGADSATAAITLAGVGGLAIPGSSRYVELVGLTALLTGALLLAAWLARLGFLANFLSRTALIGFLSGVGVSVAIGQLPELLGVNVPRSTALMTLIRSLRKVGDASLATCLVGGLAIAAMLLLRRATSKVPAAVLVVLAAILAGYWWHPERHGIRLIPAVTGGLPRWQLPAMDGHSLSALTLTSVSLAVVVLAQSAATARAYAARYDEEFDENADLFALGVANSTAAFTGAFVVNGSPTKSAMMDGAGGRSQLSQLTCGVLVLFALLVAASPLSRLALAVLAAVVLLIGVELVDISGLSRLARVRRSEFVVALITAVAVVAVGVEQAIALAIVASIIDHLRRGYDPHTHVLVRNPGGHWQLAEPLAQQRTRDGLLIYRFPSSMYYANAHKLSSDLAGFLSAPQPLTLFCLDCTGVGDLDYTAAEVLRAAMHRYAARGARFAFATADGALLRQLRLYGLLADQATAWYPTPGAALDAYDRDHPASATD